MALYSIDVLVDPKVEGVTLDITMYFKNYIEYLLENEEEGVKIFLNDDPSSMWYHFVDNYERRVKLFGLNPKYQNFKYNRLLFENLLVVRKKALRRCYGVK